MCGLLARAEAAPEEAPSSCIPASSLFPTLKGKAKAQLYKTIERSHHGRCFLLLLYRLDKNQWYVKHFHKSFWKLSGREGLSQRTTSALDPPFLPSNRSPPGTQVCSNEGFASFRTDIPNFVLTVHRGPCVDAEAAMLHVHFCTPAS